MQLSRFRSDRYIGYVDAHYDGEALRAILSDPESVATREGAVLIPTRPGRTVHRVEIETPQGSAVVYTHLLVNTRWWETIRPAQAFTVLSTARRMLACGLPTSRVIAAVRPRM